MQKLFIFLFLFYSLSIINGMDNEDWFTEKNFQYTLSENKITIRKYIGSSSIVRVPAEINSYPVICLGKESFSNHLSLKKISIPSSITQIENGAL